MYRKLTFLLMMFFLMTCYTYAQWDDEDEKGNDKHHHKHSMNFRRIFDKPTIQIGYGLTKENLDGFSDNFENTSIAEIKLGYSGQWESWFGKKVLRYNYPYFTVGVISSDLDGRNKTNGYLQSTLWRFGFGREEGYTIKAGSVGILPYTSSQMMWSRLDMKQLPDSSNLTDSNHISLFNKSFRFGSSFDGGISFQFSKLISFQVEYERANIYQRHLFFINMASGIIEAAGNEIINTFVGSILRKEPLAGSIVNFILKGIYEFGISELRSKQMNWPFGGEACLNYHIVKAGFGFTF